MTTFDNWKYFRVLLTYRNQFRRSNLSNQMNHRKQLRVTGTSSQEHTINDIHRIPLIGNKVKVKFNYTSIVSFVFLFNDNESIIISSQKSNLDTFFLPPPPNKKGETIVVYRFNLLFESILLGFGIKSSAASSFILRTSGSVPPKL